MGNRWVLWSALKSILPYFRSFKRALLFPRRDDLMYNKESTYFKPVLILEWFRWVGWKGTPRCSPDGD